MNTDVLERKRWVVVCPSCQRQWRFAHEADAAFYVDVSLSCPGCGGNAFDYFKEKSA